MNSDYEHSGEFLWPPPRVLPHISVATRGCVVSPADHPAGRFLDDLYIVVMYA